MSDSATATPSRVSLPINFPPAPFEFERAKQCIRLVITGYNMYQQWTNQDKPKESDFKWTPKPPKGMDDLHFSKPLWGTDTILWFFKDPEPVAFVASNDEGDVFLAFRGTESVEDWVEDADADQKPYTLAPGYGNVHHGFNCIYESMSQVIAEALAAVENPKRLFISGHSLGSSIATLSVPDIITNTDYKPDRLPVWNYNFASPRTGDPVFATTYNQNGVPTWRVVNSADIVPTVPPSVVGNLIYEHVGTSIGYTAQYDGLGDNHSAKHSYRYAIQHSKQPQGPVASDT